MDRKMPDMSGEETTKIIRELPGGKDVVIIALTASAFEDEESLLLDAGMDDFVLKPYDINQIFKKLKKHLNIEYIYKDIHKINKQEQNEKIEFSHNKFEEKLKELDLQTLEKIYEAALLLEKDLIINAIKNLDNDLKFMFEYLIENIQYEIILNDVKKAIELNKTK
jgi:DNA-binding response OmpR family regulator